MHMSFECRCQLSSFLIYTSTNYIWKPNLSPRKRMLPNRFVSDKLLLLKRLLNKQTENSLAHWLIRRV